MKKVKLGDLDVGIMGLGCMSMTDVYGTGDVAAGEATLHRAIELGVTLFDTANVYGQGENERLVGRALAAHREKASISTKFGFVVGPKGPGLDGHPDRVADRCEESLARLGTDHIDLYFLHRPDPKVPVEDSVGAMARLVEAGKVRHLGLCEVSAETLRKAYAVHPITAVQSEYSLWTRDPEDEVLPACRALGVGFVPFSPIGRAMLTGAITETDSFDAGSDMRGTMPRFQGENLQRNLKLVSEVTRIADALGIKPGQVALAWLLTKGDFIAPIPGTKRCAYLEENVAAAEVALPEEIVAELDDVFAPGKVSGARYGQKWMESEDTAKD